MSTEAREYRVVWQREDCRQRTKIYQTRAGAVRWWKLVSGAEPPSQIFHGADPGADELHFTRRFEENLPELLFCRIESRPVGGWSEECPHAP